MFYLKVHPLLVGILVVLAGKLYRFGMLYLHLLTYTSFADVCLIVVFIDQKHF